MSNPTKRIKYSDFMKMSPQERMGQSEFFRMKYPNMVPVVVHSKSTDIPELPNCKFLMNKDKQLYGELNMIRIFIQKNLGKIHNQSEGLFFSYNRKLLSNNIKVSEFIGRDFKDLEKDGWVHIQFGKQERFGQMECQSYQNDK